MPLPNQRATVTLRYGSDDQPNMALILHYVPQAAGSLTQANVEALAAAVNAHLIAEFQLCITTESNYFGLDVLANDEGVTYTAQMPVAIPAGSVGGDTLPDYAAVVIRKRSGVAGAPGRGRWFIGCVPEAYTDTSGVNDSGMADGYTALAAKLIAPVTAAGKVWNSCHLSVKNGTLIPIVSATVARVLATQRRRRVRRSL